MKEEFHRVKQALETARALGLDIHEADQSMAAWESGRPVSPTYRICKDAELLGVVENIRDASHWLQGYAACSLTCSKPEKK